jgi:hypothetical protein
MKLKSFGCSFIYGSELSDENTQRICPSRKTWPALLAQHLGYQYECYALPGAGNLSIAQSVLDQAVDPTPALFVINWSFIDRFDYQFNSTPLKWSTCRPNESDLESETYYKLYHNEYRDKLTTLINMQACVTALQGHKVIMTYMDDLIFDQRWHVTPGVLSMQNSLKPIVKTFNDKNFRDWAQSQGHKITAAGHLLDSGHRAAFEYVLNHNFV